MKRLLFVLCLIVLAGTMLSCSEVTTTRTRITTTTNECIAGVYYVDGIRYVAIVEGSDPEYVAKLQAGNIRAFGYLVRFVYVEHSLAELDAIRDDLWNHREAFGIVAIGRSERLNTLTVTVLDLTDEIAAGIVEVTGLDDIVIGEGTYPEYTEDIEIVADAIDLEDAKS